MWSLVNSQRRKEKASGLTMASPKETSSLLQIRLNHDLDDAEEARRPTRLWLVLFYALAAVIVICCVWFSPMFYSPPLWASARPLSVAFLGNSLVYINDFPRFLQALSNNTIDQNSCLNGGASISTLIQLGNGMYPQFRTNESVLGQYHHETIYDYGACTPQQLLTGVGGVYNLSAWKALEDAVEENFKLNPCAEDPVYAQYIQHYFQENAPNWDFVVINDFSRNPAFNQTRQEALETLRTVYVPWLQQMKATVVFLWTYAYIPSNPNIDMTGIDSVANFTSLTGVGYRAYVDLLEQYLPESPKPRIAPVALAFLIVYEENRPMWYRLFHVLDNWHSSPHGTFLQGCVVYYTLRGCMPDRSVVIRDDMASLWKHARMMQHSSEPTDPMLDRVDAEYLYSIAERVMVHGHIPVSYIDYQNGEVADTGQ